MSTDKSIIGYTENLGLTLYRKGTKDWDSGYIAAMQKIDQEIPKALDSHNISGIESDSVFDNLTEIKAQLDTVTLPYRKLATLTQPFGFYGEVWYKDSDEIVIKPKVSPYGTFIGVILNDGEYLESSSAITIKYDTPANSGHILNGIGKLANSCQIIRPYKDVSGNLAFGFDWMPITTFTEANPTNTLSLAQVDSKDIGLLFPEGAELVVFDSSSKLQTPIWYSGGSYDPTSTLYVSSRNANTLTLNKNLNISSLSGGKVVYQVSGFKPIDYSTGSIASVIGTRGYSDIGIRIRTDGSGNIEAFVKVGNKILFKAGATDNGQGCNDGRNAILHTGAVNRLLYCPPDKTISFCNINSTNSARAGHKLYFENADYRTTSYHSDVTTYSTVIRHEVEVMHGLIRPNNYNANATYEIGYEI